MVQWDHDGELGPVHGVYGTLDVELEVQRITKRAELTAFLCLLEEVVGSTKVHFDKRNFRWAVERRNEMHRSESWRC